MQLNLSHVGRRRRRVYQGVRKMPVSQIQLSLHERKVNKK